MIYYYTTVTTIRKLLGMCIAWESFFSSPDESPVLNIYVHDTNLQAGQSNRIFCISIINWALSVVFLFAKEFDLAREREFSI